MVEQDGALFSWYGFLLTAFYDQLGPLLFLKYISYFPFPIHITLLTYNVVDNGPILREQEYSQPFKVLNLEEILNFFVGSNLFINVFRTVVSVFSQYDVKRVAEAKILESILHFYLYLV